MGTPTCSGEVDIRRPSVAGILGAELRLLVSLVSSLAMECAWREMQDF